MPLHLPDFLGISQSTEGRLTAIEDRILAIENQSKIVSQTTCSKCHSQVARYMVTKQGAVVCANCDLTGYKKYIKGL